GGTSGPSLFGAVHNAWKLDSIAGGSSGGSAAAVAAGLCYGALGSDTGGSIRQPSAYCGLAGLKPTYGRISTRGVIPLSWSLDHVGPITTTVADAAIVLQAIAGCDRNEISSAEVPTSDYVAALQETPWALRVGIPRSFFFDVLDQEIPAAINEAVAVITKLSAGVRRE